MKTRSSIRKENYQLIKIKENRIRNYAYNDIQLC